MKQAILLIRIEANITAYKNRSKYLLVRIEENITAYKNRSKYYYLQE